MKPNFLTMTNLIRGKIADLTQQVFKLEVDTTKTDTVGYEFVTLPSTAIARNNGIIGIYKNKKGEKVVIKKHNYKFKDLDYYYLLNETKILGTFKSSIIREIKCDSGINIRITKLIDFNDAKGQIYLVVEFAEGIPIEQLSEDKMVKILDCIIPALDKVYKQMPPRITNTIPKRTNRSFLLSFMFYLIKSVIRDLRNSPLYIKLAFEFYYNYLLSGSKQEFTLSHRDLSEGNILYDASSNSVTIVESIGKTLFCQTNFMTYPTFPNYSLNLYLWIKF